jgi:FkbM family methyltransferase
MSRMTTVGLPGASFGPGARRARLLATYEIDLVVDVGANTGQYGASLRGFGYAGRIASFEPGASAFAGLRERTTADPGWECRRLALGACPGSATLNIAADDRASSLLDVMGRHVRAAPESAFARREEVEVQRLDALWARLSTGATSTYLKIDVQGAELGVLRGGESAVDECLFVELELSLVPLYETGPLFYEAVDWLRDRGFVPVAFECVLDDDRSGQMLQVDGIFAAQARLAERG